MVEPLTRESVVAAARELIRLDGLEEFSLRRVARGLEVTAPALYAHVQSKRDLLRAVADAELAELSERFGRVEVLDPLARTAAYCRAYVDHALENPQLFRTMFLFPPGLGLGEPPGWASQTATQAFFVSSEAIVDGIQSGRFRPADPLLATFATWMAMHGVAEVLLMGFDFDEDYRRALVDEALTVVLRGLAADPTEVATILVQA